MSDDRRKSWRELDKARDQRGGSTRRRDPDARGRERAERSGAYGAYKAQLDKMFGPGGTGLPEHLKAQLGPESEESKARGEARRAFESEPSDATLRTLLDAGLEVPEDARFLMGTLSAFEDEANLRVVLDKLLAIVESGKKPNRMLLLQRLAAVEHDLEDEETLDLVRDLRDALGA